VPETKRHLQLKDLALAWLRAVGCRAVATEVACPFHRYRFDALGWLDHADDARAVEAFGQPLGEPRAPRTNAVECKQSRADFASDDADPAELTRRKAYLLERRAVIEELRVKVRETHLKVLHVLEQAKALTQRYHVVVANPPYMLHVMRFCEK
jgi:hypothetical protein